MSNEEVNEILEEMRKTRPEKLNPEAKRLFEAIMKIADERDKAEAELYECNNIINDYVDELRKKNEMIHKTIIWINEHETPFDDCHKYHISCADISCEECIKKYFEERCK